MRELAGVIAVAALTGGACDRSPTVASCADHLGGVWESDDGRARWHVRDGGRETLEAFPTTRELPDASAGTLAAPSVIALRRHGAEVTGTITRRWQRGGETCLVRAPATIRGCRDTRLTLTLGSTSAPTDWVNCRPPDATPATQLLHRIWP